MSDNDITQAIRDELDAAGARRVVLTEWVDTDLQQAEWTLDGVHFARIGKGWSDLALLVSRTLKFHSTRTRSGK